MSSEEKSADYVIGRGKPPKHTRWKPGQSGNPKGRPRKRKPEALAIAALLDEPVSVRKDGKSWKIRAFEASVRKLVSCAVNEGDIPAAKEFINLCEKYDVIAPLPGWARHNGYTVPKDWDWDEWVAKLRKDGPPPWPGKRSGLPVSERIAATSRPETVRKTRKQSQRLREEIVSDIASETHLVMEGNRRRRRTTLDLVFLSLRNQSAAGNVRAFKAFHELLERYAPKAGTRPTGLVLLPEILTAEEFERSVEKYRRELAEKKRSEAA